MHLYELNFIDDGRGEMCSVNIHLFLTNVFIVFLGYNDKSLLPIVSEGTLTQHGIRHSFVK